MLPRPEDWLGIISDTRRRAADDVDEFNQSLRRYGFGERVPADVYRRGDKPVARYLWQQIEGTTDFPAYFV